MFIKWILFLAVSGGILYLSRHSLGDPKSHGFHRFFAFEAILVLILLQSSTWFQDPLSPFQIFSWLLLSASLLLAIHGFHLLRVIGRPKGGFEETTQLVIVGAYKYIRHPLYASLLLLTWGAFFKCPSILSTLLALIASAFLVATARVEEAENLRKFGSAYEAYLKSTRMFLPYLL